MNSNVKEYRSVTRKFSLGYLLLCAVTVGLLLISFLSNAIISKQYKNTTDELLELNELYVDIETINGYVNSSYLYLRADSYDEYFVKCQEAKNLTNIINNKLKKVYSREIIDTVNTCISYMDKSQQLMELLQVYINSQEKDFVEYQEIEALYADSQELLSYVNHSFQSTYATKLVSVRQKQNYLKSWQTKIEVIQIILLAIGFTICFTYCFKVIKGITSSLSILTTVVQKIENDVYEEAYVEIQSNDEFEDFAKALNHMINVIQEQLRNIEENANIKEKLSAAEIENLRIYSELQKSQLRFLQSRINPHFLFNTLNMISSMARMEEAHKSAELMEITATYLRYNLNNLSKSVPLVAEIDNLKNYIYIQQCRFEDRYLYQFEVDCDCENFIVPSLILQPLVENAIQHGLALKPEGGIIRIQVKPSNQFMIIRVEDNGAGMSSERIAIIMNLLEDPLAQSDNIGLKNIYMRLKYFYSDDVKLELFPLKEGVAIQISIPFGGGKS